LQVAEFIVYGLLLGVTYGLLAIPISLLFVATGTVDVAVGSYAVLAGMLVAVIGGPLGIVAAVGSAVLVASIVGGLSVKLNRQGNDHLSLVLASFALATFLESFALTVFGKDPFIRRSFTQFWSVMGVNVNPQAAINIGVGTAFVAGTYLLLYRTSWGRDMRASAVSMQAAQLAGIAVRKVQFSTALLSGLFAGIAGVLILYTSGVDYAAGMHLTLSSFGAAILFGLQGPLRGFLGGLAIGVIEALGAGYLNSSLANLLPMCFIFVMLATGRMSRETVVGGRA
jgi:branched-chain amino acid transport system permease protein